MNGDVPRKNKFGRKRCRCASVCQRFDHMRSILRRGNPEELRRLVRSLAEDLCSAEGDAEYYRAVLSGQWPSAFEQLTAGLAKATEIRRSTETKE